MVEVDGPVFHAGEISLRVDATTDVIRNGSPDPGANHCQEHIAYGLQAHLIQEINVRLFSRLHDGPPKGIKY